MRSKEAPPAGEIERLQEALGDRWALERELGHGLTSTVYLARDLKHHRRVAVKVLRPELAASIGRERFHREIEIASSLSHPHILPLYSSGEANGQLYYVMPYVEGQTLEDRMAREGPFPVGEALRIAREVAAALAYAHQHGVVHRDIKPANVMLSAGEAVVADFGIAKAITDAGHEKLTQTGIAIGSPVYMSPEQATGERELDGRSDIYSLGCVVYEMLTGEPPAMGNTPTEVLSHRLMDDVLPLTSRVKGVPPEVEEVIETALARDRHDRYPSAEAFAEALESTGSTLPGPALSAAPKRKKAFWAELQRRKVYSTAILYAVVAWVTVEVTDTTFPHLGLEAAVPAIVLLAVIGFPVALGFAWAFEVSREGIRRTQPVAVAPANRTSLWVSGVAILALFVVIGAGIRVSSTWRTGSTAGADTPGADTPLSDFDRRRIVVGRIENRTGLEELDHLGSATAEWITQGLQQIRSFEAVPTAVAGWYVRREDEGIGDQDPIRTLGSQTGAGTVISGAYYRQGDSLRLLMEITDVSSRDLIAAPDPVVGPLDDPLTTVATARSRVLGTLAFAFDERLPEAATTAKPPNYEAYVRFSQGLENYFANRQVEAIPLFLESYALDTTFVTPLLYAAVNYSNQRAYHVEDSILDIVNRSKLQLSHYEQHWVDYRRAFLAGNPVTALSAIRFAAREAPGSKAVYNVAIEALEQGRYREAIQALQSLETESGPMLGFREYWTNLAYAHHMLGDHESELEVAQEAARHYPDQPAVLWLRVHARTALGPVDSVMAGLERISRIAPDRAGPFLQMAGDELLVHDQSEAAQELFERAAAWYLEQAKRNGAEAEHLLGQARASYALDEWETARALATAALDAGANDVDALGYIGRAAARLGDRELALEMSQRLAQLGRPYLFGKNTFRRALILAALGDREESVRTLEQAFAERCPVDGAHSQMDFQPLLEYPPFQEAVEPRE